MKHNRSLPTLRSVRPAALQSRFNTDTLVSVPFAAVLLAGILLAGILFLSGCSRGPIIPPGTPTHETAQTPTSFPTFTQTPPPTSSPPPTASPTAVLTPTSTATPSPTPLPTGYYLHEEAGYSLVIPSGWELSEENPDGASWLSNDGSIFFSFHSFPLEEETDLETVADAFLDPSQGIFPRLPEITWSEVEFAGGLTAPEVKLEGKNSQGSDLTIRIILLHRGSKTYNLFIIGPTKSMALRRAGIDQILGGIALGSPRLYGLDRSKSLVVLGYDPDPEDIDPARSKDSADSYTGLLFSGLVRLSPELQVEADLAESWSVSPDGIEYTFTLRSDARFASGRALTAGDVKYSWERAANPDTASTTVSTYLGDIAGIKDVIEGRTTEISGIKTAGDRTLVVTLDGPKPYFLAKLTYPTSFIVDREQAESETEDWLFHPNASGPFKLKEFVEDEALVFQRNAAYHTPAGVEGIVFLLYRAGLPGSLFQAGEIDLVSTGYTEAKSIQETGHSLNSQLKSATSMCISFIMFDNQAAPMDDALVREAFVRAFDKELLIDQFSESLARRPDSILPPAMPGFSTDVVQAGYDPEAAQAALAASTYAGDLPPVVLSVAGYGDSESPLLNAILEMWNENLGVRVQVEYLDPLNFAAAAREQHGQMVQFGWCADYPDPENFLDVLFHSGSSFNLSGYTNPATDRLLEQARIELDPLARLRLYNKIELLLIEDHAAIPFMNRVIYTLVSDRLQGYVQEPIGVLLGHRLTILER